MRYLALLLTILALTSGCALVFDDGGSGGDDVCAFAEEPAVSLAPQRNPENLECQSFGGGCNPSCGPCPALDLAPIPSWGFCGSTCEQLTESACASTPECRVIKELECALSKDCTTDFIGCFPTNQFTDPTTDCRAARDGFTCSLNPACTAYHYRQLVVAPDATNQLSFALCAPEGQAPGSCYAPVTCARPRPICPGWEVPVIADGCYTGQCIPITTCEPMPPPV